MSNRPFRYLLIQDSILLKDEPSNHLDSSARDWLATYLSSYQGSILLISHDVALLTKSVTHIAEVSGQTLIQYVSCNYDKYLVEKEFRAKTAMAEYERNMKEAARLQGMHLHCTHCMMFSWRKTDAFLSFINPIRIRG